MTSTTGTEFTFDPYTREVQADPYPWLTTLERDHPVWADPDGRWWAVSRYADVRALLADHETFAAGEGVVLDIDTSAMPPILTMVDPPQHTRMRRAVAGSFTARAVTDLERSITTTVRDLLDGMADADEVDLIADFCARVPPLVIADYVGVPRADVPMFHDWLLALVSDATSPAALEGMANAAAYMADALAQRATAPADDLLTVCARAEVDGEPLSDAEKLGLAWVLFVGGIEATSFHLGNTCARLTSDPNLRGTLSADPGAIASALEEILRHDSPVQADLRTVTRDTVIGSTSIPAGDKVMFLLGAANRDPRVFEHPDELDYTRAPNPHLGFGGGIHFCIGAGLARAEARIAVAELLARHPGLHATGPVTRTFTNKAFMYGVAKLPARLR
jgi:cytochrome P450